MENVQNRVRHAVTEVMRHDRKEHAIFANVCHRIARMLVDTVCPGCEDRDGRGFRWSVLSGADHR